MSPPGKTDEQPNSCDDQTSSMSSDGELESGSMSADDDCDPPEDYRDYGDWKQGYANSVGMSLYEKIR